MKLLKFEAPWCQSCKSVGAVIASLDLPFELQTVNTDEDLDTAMKYRVRGVPTLVLLDDNGRPAVTHVGSITKAQFQEKFLT